MINPGGPAFIGLIWVTFPDLLHISPGKREGGRMLWSLPTKISVHVHRIQQEHTGCCLLPVFVHSGIFSPGDCVFRNIKAQRLFFL